MITQLRLSEFKAFHSLNIELKPLTLFIGENNSGKSSILAAIRLLAQTVQSRDPTLPLAFSGLFGDFGSYRDVVHGNHRGRPFQLGISTMTQRRGMPYSASVECEFKYRTQRRETILRSVRLYENSQPIVTVTASREGDIPLLKAVGTYTVPDSLRSQLRRNLRMINFIPRIFPEPERDDRRSSPMGDALEAVNKDRGRAWHAADSIMRTLHGTDFIGAMRRPPERTYINTGVASGTIGADGGNWPAVLAMESSRRTSKLPIVRSWTRDAGIASNISVSWLSDRHYELLIKHPVSGETANIADVGRGTSQVLPVIVGGSRLDEGSVFIVEEPEIHLHPRAQAALGDFFVERAAAGVQSLVETHSEYLLMRVQQHVALGNLDPTQVVFYYVSSTPAGKEVRQLSLDEHATFRQELTGGFFPQRLEEARALVAARSGRKGEHVGSR